MIVMLLHRSQCSGWKFILNTVVLDHLDYKGEKGGSNDLWNLNH